MGEYETLKHELEPVYDEASSILILGTFPSVKSRETEFFYGHPRNRFWQVMSTCFGAPLPNTVDEKIALLHRNHIAVWDVIAHCDIIGSSDSSIKNVVPNDVPWILHQAPIKKILLNGGTAYKLYRKYCQKDIDLPAVALPSTSPANAGMSTQQLIEIWKKEL